MKLRILACGCAVLLLVILGVAQRRRDPLNPIEIDQLRDTAQDADPRLKLFVKFARARLDAVEQARSDPKVKDRGAAVHDALQDFLDVYQEMDDNIDTFVGRKADLRKTLKVVIEADTEFQAKLRALKDSGSALAAEAAKYEFVLGNTLDTVDSSAQDHRDLLTTQEEAAKHKKK